MFLLLPKRRICSTIHISLFKSARQIRPLLPHHFSTCESATQNPYPKTPKFVVADYLIATFGFSPDKAAKVSKYKGFSEANIKRLVTWCPELLSSSPEKTLDPKFPAHYDMGLSTSAINRIILSNPHALLLHIAVPRITFWMDFLGGNESAVVKAFTRNRGLVNHDINSSIAPNISLLQSHGFSNQEIARIVSTIAHLITGKASRVEDALKRTKELGFQPGSGMFLPGLNAMASVTRAALNKKMDLLKSFGWSEDDFSSAVQGAPLIVALKEENLRAKMDFLLGEARCAPSYIVSHPILLAFSLEKRLRPRNNVLHLLESRGLSVKGRGFLYAIKLNNHQFVERYIISHKEEVSGLHETYVTDCA